MEDRLPDAEEDVLNSLFVPECAARPWWRAIGLRSTTRGADEAQDLMSNDYLDVLDALLAAGLREGFGGSSTTPTRMCSPAQPKGVTRLLDCRRRNTLSW